MGLGASVSTRAKENRTNKSADLDAIGCIQTEITHLINARKDTRALDEFIEATQTYTNTSTLSRIPTATLVTDSVQKTVTKIDVYFNDIDSHLEKMRENLSEFKEAVFERCEQYSEDEKLSKRSRARQQINVVDELILTSKGRLLTAKTDSKTSDMVKTLKRQVQDLEMFKSDLKSSGIDSARSNKSEMFEKVLQSEGSEYVIEDILKWRDEALKLRRKYESLLDDNEKLRNESEEDIISLQQSNKKFISELMELRTETTMIEEKVELAQIRVQTVEEKLLDERLSHEVEINSLKATIEKNDEIIAKLLGRSNPVTPGPELGDIRLSPEGIVGTSDNETKYEANDCNSPSPEKEQSKEKEIKKEDPYDDNSTEAFREWMHEFEEPQRNANPVKTIHTSPVETENLTDTNGQSNDKQNDQASLKGDEENVEIKVILDNLQLNLNGNGEADNSDENLTDIDDKLHLNLKEDNEMDITDENVIDNRSKLHSNFNKKVEIDVIVGNNTGYDDKELHEKQKVIANSRVVRAIDQTPNDHVAVQKEKSKQNKTEPKNTLDEGVLTKSDRPDNVGLIYNRNSDSRAYDIVLYEAGSRKEIVYKRNDSDIDGNLSYHKGIGAVIQTCNKEFGVDSVSCEIIDELEIDMLPDLVEGERVVSFQLRFQKKYGVELNIKVDESLRLFVPHRHVNEFEESSLIKSVNGGDWEPCDPLDETPTSVEDVHMICTELDDLTDIKLIVIAREKVENIIAGEYDVIHESKYDTTITMKMSTATFKSRTEVKLLVHDTHRRKMLSAVELHDECKQIMSCTAFVSILCEQITKKDMCVIMRLPEDIDEECKYTMFSLDDYGWTLADCDWQKDEKQLVVHLRSGLKKYRILGLELPTVMSAEERLQAVKMLHEHASHYLVRLLFRQREDDPTQAVVICLQSKIVKAGIHELKELGYSTGGYPSSQFCLMEGDTLSLQFTGDITAKPVNSDKIELTFYPQREIATKQFVLTAPNAGSDTEPSTQPQGFLNITKKDETQNIILGETIHFQIGRPATVERNDRLGSHRRENAHVLQSKTST